MLYDIITILILAIVAEAITEIVTTSAIFFPLRSKVTKLSSFFGTLITCGYCFSVWISVILAFASPINIMNCVVSYALSIFLIHRLSNIIHDILGWFSRHQFISILAFKKGMVDEEGNGSSQHAEIESETTEDRTD